MAMDKNILLLQFIEGRTVKSAAFLEEPLLSTYAQCFSGVVNIIHELNYWLSLTFMRSRMISYLENPSYSAEI
jgi:hypothetical protein